MSELTDVLHSTDSKIFIVSLPKTGTKSMCSMLKTLQYNIKHCPSISLMTYLQDGVTQVFADTPIYCPSIFSVACTISSNKFIYIDRNIETWLDSYRRTRLADNYMDYMSRDYMEFAGSRLDKKSLVEIFGGVPWSDEMATAAHYRHREQVFNVIPKEQLLVYKFEEGWESLCKFLGKEIPTSELPHINKNALFDPII